MHQWNPERYLTYADERGRPFVELLQRVGAAEPGRVVDLGCGPGNLTALLARRWPETDVRGLDSSAEMIQRARVDVSGIDFAVTDLRDWLASGNSADVLVSNATLQWLPDHLDLLPALVQAVHPGGWLAFQVPGNFEEPSHTIRTELARRAEYAPHLDGVAVPSSHAPVRYLEAMASLGCTVDVWETTYLHVLSGADPVFTWVTGTGARPTLQALPEGLREEFAEEFRSRLRIAYPESGPGVVLPFRRIFVVAQKPPVSPR